MTQPLLLLKHLGVVLQRCVTHEWCVLLLEDDGMLAPLAAEPATACLSPAIRQVNRSDPAAIRDAFQSQIGAFYDLTGRVPTPYGFPPSSASLRRDFTSLSSTGGVRGARRTFTDSTCRRHLAVRECFDTTIGCYTTCTGPP